jgi:hypothetical protein
MTNQRSAPAPDASQAVMEAPSELSMQDLAQNVEGFMPVVLNQGKPSKFNMTGVTWNYTPGMKKIDSTVDVLGDDGNMMKTLIQYFGVTDPDNVSAASPCRVGCKCKEYMDNFAAANKEQDVAAGFLPKQLPDPKKNPYRIAGFCRHIYALYQMQIKLGYVKP